MSQLNERAIVHCAVNQAGDLLADYVRAHARAGGVVRLHLRADVPMPGQVGAVCLERTAIATIMSHVDGRTPLPKYTVTWSPERPGPYPRFVGDLRVESADDYDAFYLVLDGTYQPPLGAVGTAFDAMVGHRIAESTARNLLATIASSIEADFCTVEAAKAEARERQVRTRVSSATVGDDAR